MSHLSALMLLTLGRALCENVTDSDQRAAVVDELGRLLSADEHAELLQVAALPPTAAPLPQFKG